ncbi:MAG: hypothetical protein M3438_00830 [Pseudomonadota bacterium]|nr:hypothetical protein [Sphingomonas sp.]MDQ3477697.1 hypothetical protein [Pseudomonadota bacterium]
MSVRSFRSVFMVGGVAAAALGCYLVSLRVASERAALESVETEIVLAQRDIRLLQTEIGTRGRLAQLERWNVKVLALSAPSADQFIPDSFQLARLVTPERRPAVEAPVVYASAPAVPTQRTLPQSSDAAPTTTLVHEASLKVPAPRTIAPRPAPTAAAKPSKPSANKPAPAKLAKADPLAPQPSAKKKPAPAPKLAATSTAKDSDKTR